MSRCHLEKMKWKSLKVKTGDLVKIRNTQIYGIILAIKKMKYVGPVAILNTKRGIAKIRLASLEEVDSETGGSGTRESREKR